LFVINCNTFRYKKLRCLFSKTQCARL
jgi:hypothetical protein